MDREAARQTGGRTDGRTGEQTDGRTGMHTVYYRLVLYTIYVYTLCTGICYMQVLYSMYSLYERHIRKEKEMRQTDKEIERQRTREPERQLFHI